MTQTAPIRYIKELLADHLFSKRVVLSTVKTVLIS